MYKQFTQWEIDKEAKETRHITRDAEYNMMTWISKGAFVVTFFFLSLLASSCNNSDGWSGEEDVDVTNRVICQL